MAATTYPEFSAEAIDQALEAARRHSSARIQAVSGQGLVFADGSLKVGAQCISVTVQNGQVCLNLPVVGSECFSVPTWVPNGTAVQACLDICTKWGVPCGVEVTVSLAGQRILSKGFGCSC